MLGIVKAAKRYRSGIQPPLGCTAEIYYPDIISAAAEIFLQGECLQDRAIIHGRMECNNAYFHRCLLIFIVGC